MSLYYGTTEKLMNRMESQETNSDTEQWQRWDEELVEEFGRWLSRLAKAFGLLLLIVIAVIVFSCF